MDTEKVTLAVIGAGSMGSAHIASIGSLPNVQLAAVCDIDRRKADSFAATYGVKAFYNHRDLLQEKAAEAIIIATPHYAHTTISIDAFAAGIHVLSEKPVGVHVADIEKTIASYTAAKRKKKNLVYAVMFQQRTYGYWRKIKSLIDGGDLGRLIRATWIITDWYRTQAYYNSSDWRATWAGEGGGVLINQCVHNLDLYQWFFGMPERVTAVAGFGKYHRIEVEDEVSAIFEHKNGMIGHLMTTTAESPGTNRLEIAAEKGKLVFENRTIAFYRNRTSVHKHIYTATGNYDKIETWKIDVPYEKSIAQGEDHRFASGHPKVIEMFADAVRGRGKPLVEGTEGLNAMMIANSILLSSLTKKRVTLPVSGAAMKKLIDGLVRNPRPIIEKSAFAAIPKAKKARRKK